MTEHAKYEALAEYLAAAEARAHPAFLEVTLTFPEIELILGAQLPATARRNAAFWSNDLTHCQARAWVARGWMTQRVSITQERVSFVANEKAARARELLAQLELLAVVHGSRRAARDRLRALEGDAGSRLRAGQRDTHEAEDRRHFAAMAEALSNDARVSVDVHRPARRGQRPRLGPGTIAARSTGRGSATIRLMFVEGCISVDVRFGDDLAMQSRWPRGREADALRFMALWGSLRPWLGVGGDDRTGGEVSWRLTASLSLVRPHTPTGCRRTFSWLCYETEAFEDGLRKILTRKTPVAPQRALELAARRLSRHRRPRLDVVTTRCCSQGVPTWHVGGDAAD